MALIKGKAVFSSTAKADTKFGAPGNYYVTLEVSPETYADAQATGLKCKSSMYNGKEQLTVNLKLKGGGTRKDGSAYLNDPIPVVIKKPDNPRTPYVEKARDENGELVERRKEIPRGSKVRISYKAREWEMMGRTGTSFDLKAVQIIEEGASSDAMSDFDEDDDFADDEF